MEHILSLSYGKDSLACLGAIEKRAQNKLNEKLVFAIVTYQNAVLANQKQLEV